MQNVPKSNTNFGEKLWTKWYSKIKCDTYLDIFVEFVYSFHDGVIAVVDTLISIRQLCHDFLVRLVTLTLCICSNLLQVYTIISSLLQSTVETCRCKHMDYFDVFVMFNNINSFSYYWNTWERKRSSLCDDNYDFYHSQVNLNT